MSYRDMRNFTEMMRALGYPRLISMENFRIPNFPLVAEILSWLVKRYDTSADLHCDIDTQQDRVIFIKMAAQFMATKAHIRLNTKKLYQADGYAVKELLKVTSTLYEAMNRDPELEESGDTGEVTALDMARINDIKEARSLASLITGRGAALFDLLGREVALREARNTALGRQLELPEVEAGIQASAKAVEAEIVRTAVLLETIAADEANLEAKIEKRRGELERNQKRLSTLQSVRPAYMDEYERLEVDLERLYVDYMRRFRNLAFLESLYEDHCRTELERAEETEMTLQRMSEEMRAIEEQGLTEDGIGPAIMDEKNEDEVSEEDDDEVEEEESGKGPFERRLVPGLRGASRDKSVQKRPKAPSSGSRRTGNFGSMVGVVVEDDEEDEDEDEDDEEDTDDDLEDSDIEVDDSDEDAPPAPSEAPAAQAAPAAAAAAASLRPRRPVGASSGPRVSQPTDDSDNDF